MELEMNKYLWLIRHGESQGNAELRVQGWHDYPLTSLGEQQAECLAVRLTREKNIKHIISSPLTRAAETAHFISQTLQMPIDYDDRLKEYNFGPINGLKRTEIAQRFAEVWQIRSSNHVPPPLPEEEGEIAFQTRVKAALDDIVARIANESAAAVVMHGGTMDACLRVSLGINGPSWRIFGFGNASLTLLRLSFPPPLTLIHTNDTEYAGRILTLNDTRHLNHLEREKV